MKFKLEQKDDISVITLSGDFLGETEHFRLRDQVHELTSKGKRHLIIDLGKVGHINSCGLGALVCAHTSMRRAGGELKLIAVGKSVSELLKLTRLDMLLEILPAGDKLPK